MSTTITAPSKEVIEQGENFIARLVGILQNSDKITVNIVYCQTCVADNMVFSTQGGSSINVAIPTTI